MPHKLKAHEYGVNDIALTRLISHGKRHDVKNLVLSIMLSGRFETSFTHKDNSSIYSPASIRNTVFALAKTCPPASTPKFIREIARHFLDHETIPVESIRITAMETAWPPMKVSGVKQPFAFEEIQGETLRYSLETSHTRPLLFGGIQGMRIMKTGVMASKGTLQDEHSASDNPDDRVLYLTLDASWLFDDWTHDAEKAYPTIRDALTSCFSRHSSQSIQETLYEMGLAALDADQSIIEIDLTIQAHRLHPVKLKPRDLKNNMEVFDSAAASTEVFHGVICR